LNLSAFIFTLVLAGPAAGTTPAKADPSSTTPAVDKVRLEVDHRALLAQQMADAAEDSAFFVREDGSKALREQHGVDVVDDDGAPAIVVKLAWKDYEGSVYLIEVATRRPGQAPSVVESFEATCINNTALTKAVVAKLPAALERLAEPEPVVTTEPPPEPEPAEPVVEAPAEQTDDSPRVPLGSLGKAGIGVGVVGAGTLISGGVLYALGRRFDPPTGRLEERDGRNFHPPGVALMVTGGAALVTGVVLILVDRTRARRSASALVLPSPGGLVVTGRF
jgi:hypothetical protein